MEQHHPIMDKLRGLGGRTYRQMVVIGKQAFVFSHSGQYANVKAFTDKVKGIPKVPIVNAVIA